MRAIKFRGKKKSGEWLYGDLMHYCGSTLILPLDANWYDFVPKKDNPLRLPSSKFEVEPATVGQFTGRYDKKGNEIYDGDILQDDDKRKYQVTWDIQLSRWSLVYGSCYYSMTEVEIHFQVIGNIHDNPELLKGGKR